MAKVVAVVILAAILIFGALWFFRKNPSSDRVNELMVVEQDTPTKPETLGISTNGSRASSDLNTYVDEDQGYRIKYPKDITLKKIGNDTVELSGKGLEIAITSSHLTGVETINTVSEQHINEKMALLGDNFKLLESISPISIGSLTGITYTSEENSQEITYYYVPQKQGYLFLINRTDTSEYSILSASDDIIYSLELF